MISPPSDTQACESEKFRATPSKTWCNFKRLTSF